MLFHGSCLTGLCPCIVSGFTDNLVCRQYCFLLPSTSGQLPLFFTRSSVRIFFVPLTHNSISTQELSLDKTSCRLLIFIPDRGSVRKHYDREEINLEILTDLRISAPTLIPKKKKYYPEGLFVSLRASLGPEQLEEFYP